MTKSEYLKRASDAFASGKVDETTYDAMIMNADIFAEEDEDETSRLPSWYAEVEYEDVDSYEAHLGMKYDDMNFMHYMER